MTENNVALISKCMKALRTSVGVVDAEKFLFLMRSEAFDYTKWQRDYFDAMSPEEIDVTVKYPAPHKISDPARNQHPCRVKFIHRH